jgi:hypothetical protein
MNRQIKNKSTFFTFYFDNETFLPSFSLAQRKEAKETSTPTKPPPIWGGCN